MKEENEGQLQPKHQNHLEMVWRKNTHVLWLYFWTRVITTAGIIHWLTWGILHIDVLTKNLHKDLYLLFSKNKVADLFLVTIWVFQYSLNKTDTTLLSYWQDTRTFRNGKVKDKVLNIFPVLLLKSAFQFWEIHILIYPFTHSSNLPKVRP